MTELPLLLGAGAIAGALAGLLGIGGGIIIVPVLVLVFEHQGVASSLVMHIAIGTSLATIAFTSLASIWAHHAHDAILWSLVARITPGVLLGAVAGAAVADAVHSDTLRAVFSIFMLVIAAQLVTGRTTKAHRSLPREWGLYAIGGLIGAVSAFFGIGGGSLSVPVMTWCNIPVRKAVATSAAIGLPIAVAGGLGFVYWGWNITGRPEWSLGYVNLPATLGIVIASTLAAPFGAKLAHRMPEHLLRTAFAILLVTLAAKMMLGS